MKPWPLLIGIVVILGIFCSPGLAVISKSDLISQYKAGQFWEPVTPAPTPTPTVIPTTVPTQAPGQGTTSGTPDYSRWLTMRYRSMITDDGSYITPTPTPTVIPTTMPTPAPPIWSSPVSYTKSSYLDSLSGFYPLKPSISFIDSTSFGKPNIYLYSDRDLTARVRLAPEEAITVSEPVYQPGKGWQAEIRNGSLNGNGDFLFYEGTGPDSGWQKDDGYIIRGSSREQDMAFMLGPYGFNEKETAEFIEYWASHLVGDVDFVFYPQETAVVDSVMPLSISPEPNHVMRIWFYAEPLITAPEPVTHPERIIREGFYVVEWGVIIDDEYWINHSPSSSEVVV
jgi:hypothetical protein